MVMWIAGISFSLSAWGGTAKNEESDAERLRVMVPLYFIENKGQVDEKVRFYEKGSHLWQF